MHDLKIREYAEADAAALEHCIVELQSFEQAIYRNRADGSAIASTYREQLLTQCRECARKIFVAESGERIVGFICTLAEVDSRELIEADTRYAYLTDLVVLPAFRRSGIAQLLIATAETYVASQGATVVKVDVLAANAGARELYARTGYLEDEIRLSKRLR